MLRRLFTVVLLVLWLPATAHCSIEATTDWLAELCGTHCCDDAPLADADACTLVESGEFTPAVPAAQVPPPSLSTLACLACLHARLLAEAAPLPSYARSKNHPDDWVPAWSFVHRAAPPARAPDLLS